MSSKYLNDSGLAYFWTKIKAYVANLLGSKADDANVVHKTGDESIDGYKIFLKYVRSMSSFNTKRAYFADDIHVSENAYGTLADISDRDNNVLAELYYGQEPDDDTVFVLRSRSKDRNSAGYVTLRHNESSGVFVLEIPTPPADSNTNHAASTSWVRSFGNNTYLPLAGGTLTGSVRFKRSNITRGTAPSSVSDLQIADCVDSANNRISLIESSYYTDKSSKVALYAYKTTAASGANIGSIGIGCTSAGNVYTFAPTPATSDNSTQIATTAFVKNQNYLSGTVPIENGGTGATSRLLAVRALTNENVSTNAQYFLTITTNWTKAGYTSVNDAKTVLGLKSAAYTDSTDYVHTTGNETISGTKTFNSRINGTINYKMTAAKKDSNPSSNAYITTVQVTDNDDDIISELFFGRETGGGSGTVIRTWRRDRTNTVSWNTYMPLVGRGYCFGNLYKDMVFVNNNADLGTIPSSIQWWSLAFQDKDGESFGGVWFNASTGGSCEYAIRCNTNLASGGVSKTIWIYQNQDKTSAAGITADTFRPTLNTFAKLGDTGGSRWGQIYSTSSTISTSDERQKCEISRIPDEILDAWETCEFYQYKMLASVDKKGNNARYHTGMIAQRLKSKFDAVDKNLDKYGLFCYDEWGASEARLDENGNITEPAMEAGNEYSIRYEEALCMEAAYQRRENARLKKRIADLEERLAALEFKIA